VRGHLEETASHGFHTFWELLRDPNAGRALMFMAALVMGHITIIPLLAPYLVANVGMPEEKLFLIYLIGGVCSAFTAPMFGKMADRHGHMRVYTFLIVVACVVTLMLTNARQLPVWAVLILAAGFFTFASGRFVPAQAIVSLAVPARRRGSFMSLSSCTRDLTTGFTTSLGGWIVTKAPSGQLVNYSILGWIAVGVSLFSLWLAKRVQANEVHQPTFTSTSAAVE
jgi:DHA1 family inner membrane transport protein